MEPLLIITISGCTGFLIGMLSWFRISERSMNRLVDDLSDDYAEELTKAEATIAAHWARFGYLTAVQQHIPQHCDAHGYLLTSMAQECGLTAKSLVRHQREGWPDTLPEEVGAG